MNRSRRWTNRSSDVCVVGGGYTGLSSALHLAEMGYDVVVLEGRASASAPAAATAVSWLTPTAAISTSLKKLRPGCGENARQHDV
jgi:glycine/D-amino acid oxidase-like deaminating enzyme